MKINLIENIWIEGFEREESLYAYHDFLCFNNNIELLYTGETNELPKKLISSIIGTINENTDQETWMNYSGFDNLCITPEESIKSACIEKFCIIYKK